MILVVSPLLGIKITLEFEKSTPFECGFDPKGGGHLDFSVRYFLIAIVFLIFDVEIALLLPLLVISSRRIYVIWAISSFIFLLVLTLGTFFEWIEGVFEWKK